MQSRAPEVGAVLLVSGSELTSCYIQRLLADAGYRARQVDTPEAGERALAEHAERGVLLIDELLLEAGWARLLEGRPHLALVRIIYSGAGWGTLVGTVASADAHDQRQVGLMLAQTLGATA